MLLFGHYDSFSTHFVGWLIQTRHHTEGTVPDVLALHTESHFNMQRSLFVPTENTFGWHLNASSPPLLFRLVVQLWWRSSTQMLLCLTLIKTIKWNISKGHVGNVPSQGWNKKSEQTETWQGTFICDFHSLLYLLDWLGIMYDTSHYSPAFMVSFKMTRFEPKPQSVRVLYCMALYYNWLRPPLCTPTTRINPSSCGVGRMLPFTHLCVSYIVLQVLMLTKVT